MTINDQEPETPDQRIPTTFITSGGVLVPGAVISLLNDLEHFDGQKFLGQCIAIIHFLDPQSSELQDYIGGHIPNPDAETAKAIYHFFKGNVEKLKAYVVVPNRQIFDLIQDQAKFYDDGDSINEQKVVRIFDGISNKGREVISGAQSDFEDIPFVIPYEDAEYIKSINPHVIHHEWRDVQGIMSQYITSYNALTKQN